MHFRNIEQTSVLVCRVFASQYLGCSLTESLQENTILGGNVQEEIRYKNEY